MSIKFAVCVVELCANKITVVLLLVGNSCEG